MLQEQIIVDTHDRYYVPIWLKTNLTVKEAAAISGIGERSIREMAESEGAHFAFRLGNKVLINRQLFDQYIMDECIKLSLQ